MKKIITFLALSVLFSLCIVGFAACDEPTEPTHKHNYATEWVSDENYHWHACTYEGCKEISAKAPHGFEEINEDGKLFRKCTECGYKIKVLAEEHEHTYSEEFNFDEDYHWHVCTFNGCGLKSDLAEHSFDNPEITQTNNSITRKYVCAYCGYEKVETITVETIIENEEKWQDAFTNLELINYSLKVETKFDGAWEQALVDKNGTHLWANGIIRLPYDIIGDKEEYTDYYAIKNQDGTFDNYAKTFRTDNWIKLSKNTSTLYEYISIGGILPFSLTDDFDKFEYDEEQCLYYNKEQIFIDIDDPYAPLDRVYTMRIDKAEVKAIDGKITYISAEYYYPEELNPNTSVYAGPYSFIYWDIGTTKVVLPAEVANSAIPQ